MPATWRTRLAAALGLLIGSWVHFAPAQTLQPTATCRNTPWVSAGGAIGRSGVDIPMSRQGASLAPTETLRASGSGAAWMARADVGIAQRFRARVESAATDWGVMREDYTGRRPAGQNPPRLQEGRIRVRDTTITLGGQTTGQRGGAICGYLLVGGGAYSLNYNGAILRQPGMAVMAGMEFPTGDHGMVQAEIQFHGISTRSRFPVSAYSTFALAATIGWSYRF